MAATAEQQLVIDTAGERDCTLLKVSACSGSGKTWTLVELVKSRIENTPSKECSNLKAFKGLYVAYNKAIATEAGTKFPDAIDCRTTHSLAYASTVRPFGLKVGFFGYRDIKHKLTYEQKLNLIDAIEEFCLSKYTSFTDFITYSEYPTRFATLGEDILAEMVSGKVTCTHAFYLKLYHVMLVNKTILPEQLDILLLDEAGDLNEVTLEIFMNYPAVKRVMVGDPNQNIYSFNKTINGFESLKGKGTQLGLTKSFRVDADIAIQIQAFARDTFDKTMLFHGVHHKDSTIKSRAFISRTNGQLISKMLDLNSTNTPYNLVRPVKSIFALPMVLISLKKGGFVANPQYKFLQEDTDDYYKSATLQRSFRSPMAYIAELHENNPGIKSAINIIHSQGPNRLIKAKDIASEYESSKTTYDYTVCTSHSSKGLEFDAVEIGEDTNLVLGKILSKPRHSWKPEDYEEMRLFYVAATRARKELTNAKHLLKYEAEDLGFNL